MHSTETKRMVKDLKEFGKDDEFYKKMSKIEGPLIYYHNCCRKIAIFTRKKTNKIIISWNKHLENTFADNPYILNSPIINNPVDLNLEI